jgi:hypothetical protein
MEGAMLESRLTGRSRQLKDQSFESSFLCWDLVGVGFARQQVRG